jgi:hypothetical protein
MQQQESVRKENSRQLQILLSPEFLIGLLLLLMNDFVFKELFHNWITGKLSDFAGLFIFPLFWSALFPKRKALIYFLCALGFVYWKSGYSQPLIDWFNSISTYQIGRVVDGVDLLALFALPLSYYSTPRAVVPALWVNTRRIAICFSLVFSIFAFTATQFKNHRMISYDKDFSFRLSKSELIARVKQIGLRDVSYHKIDNSPPLHTLSEEEREVYSLWLNTEFCKGSVSGEVTFHQDQDKTILRLDYINYWCDEKLPEHRQALLALFEQEVVTKLNSFVERR